MHDVGVPLDAPEHAEAEILGGWPHGATALVALGGDGGLLGRRGAVDAVELTEGDGGGVDGAGEEVAGGMRERGPAAEEAGDVIVAKALRAVEGVEADDRGGNVLGGGEGCEGPGEEHGGDAHAG